MEFIIFMLHLMATFCLKVFCFFFVHQIKFTLFGKIDWIKYVGNKVWYGVGISVCFVRYLYTSPITLYYPFYLFLDFFVPYITSRCIIFCWENGVMLKQRIYNKNERLGIFNEPFF